MSTYLRWSAKMNMHVGRTTTPTQDTISTISTIAREDVEMKSKQKKWNGTESPG